MNNLNSIYRVNGTMMNEEKFREKICATLIDYRFATLQQLSVIMKARLNDVQSVLDEIIVNYVKQNPNKTYGQVCTELFVRSEFIEKLIEEKRLEIRDASSFGDIKNLEVEISKQTALNVEEAKKRAAITGLQGSITQPKVIIKEEKNGPQFYTNISKK